MESPADLDIQIRAHVLANPALYEQAGRQMDDVYSPEAFWEEDLAFYKADDLESARPGSIRTSFTAIKRPASHWQQIVPPCAPKWAHMLLALALPAMATRPVHTPAYRRLCKQLRLWREEAAFTQRDLAARLRKPRSFVYKCETGNRRIDPLELAQWCKACRVSGAEMLVAVGMSG